MDSMIKRKNFKVVLISLFGFDIGAYAVSAFMKTKGYEVYNIDFCRLKIPLEFMLNDYFTPAPMSHDHFPEQDLRLLLGLLKRINPGLIGLSVSSVCFRTAAWVTRSIKAAFEAPVVWGGVHAIIAPEECICHADIVCKGEGELAFYETAERVRRKQPLAGIHNMVIRTQEGLEDNPMDSLIHDLDSLPAADRLDGKRIFFIDKGVVVQNPASTAGYVLYGYPIMTTRGCRYKCSFCCNSIISEKYKGLGPYLRRRSVDHVIGELRLAVQQRAVSFVRFWDDVFTYDEEWIDDFCTRYAAEVGKPFICYAHPKHTKPEVLEKLSRTGLTMVYIGIQSGSLMTNKELFKRNQSNKDVIGFTEKAQSLSITPNYDIIFDNFFERPEDEHNTAEMLLSLPRPYKVLLFSLCLFPKTPLTNRAIREGRAGENDLEQHTSKAINNFFLCIQRSGDGRFLFWNCIKAMAVNKYFPKSFIRFCMRAEFFKKYPSLLFRLCRAWLFLFKRPGKKKPADWLMPAVNRDSFLDDYIIWEGSRGLHRKANDSCILFPCGSGRFCLRLNYKDKRRMEFEGLQLELCRLKSDSLSEKNIWRLIYPMSFDSGRDIMLELRYPEIHCCIEGEKLKFSLHKRSGSRLSGNTPYFLKAGILKRGNIIVSRLNNFTLASAIFLTENEKRRPERCREQLCCLSQPPKAYAPSAWKS